MGHPVSFLNHIHYFRGFAIVNIAMAHLWSFPAEFRHNPNAGWIYAVREILFHGSTTYFVFISGFLLCHLAPRIKTVRYYKNKLCFVISPFLFMTLLVSLLRYLLATPAKEFSPSLAITQLGETLLSGTAQIQYWYIPFFTPIFAISPLLLKIPKTNFNILCAALAFLPVLGSRAGTAITIGQYAYFFPVYLLGMRAARDYPEFLRHIKHRFKHLGFLFLISSVALVLLFSGILEKPRLGGLIDVTESLFYFQKLSLCFMALIFWESFETKQLPAMKKLAEYSFAIFFTHTLLFSFMDDWFYLHVYEHFGNLLLPFSILFAAAIFLLNLLLCIAAKTILGAKSRYFIGA